VLSGSRPFVGPFEQDDLRPAIQAERKKGPTEATIDVNAMPSRLVRSFYATIASRGEPKRRHPRKSPLPTMTMAAEDEIDVMMLFQLIEDVGGMGEEQSVAVLIPRGKAIKISSVE